MTVSLVYGSVKPLSCGVADFSESLGEQLRGQGIRVEAVDRRDWSLLASKSILTSCLRGEPDIVHLQYPSAAYGSSIGPHAMALLNRGVPLVVTLHEFLEAHVARRLSMIAFAFAAARLVFTRTAERDAYVSAYPWTRDRAGVIPIGSSVPSRAWRPAETFRVVYFGQIRPNKGLEEFLACAELSRERRNFFTFQVVGSPVPRFLGYFRQFEQRIGDLGVEFVANPELDRVADLLASASVGYFPFPDGASLRRSSLMAAFATGLPVVTTRGPHTDADFPGGLCYASDPPEALAAIERFAASRSDLQAAHVASHGLGQRWGWSAIAREHKALYESLRRRRRG